LAARVGSDVERLEMEERLSEMNKKIINKLIN
jgi:hypothetical protein